MSKKYNEEMEKIKLSNEARSRILQNISAEMERKEKEEKRNSTARMYKQMLSMAACFIAVCGIGIGMLNMPSNEQARDVSERPQYMVQSTVASDICPMICIDGVLYKDTNKEANDFNKEDYEYIGDIKSVIDNTEIPNENLQANCKVNGVYQKDNEIIAEIDGRYFVFKRAE